MGYRVLSKYRSELMGAAMLWVMLFHAFDLDLGFGFLNYLRAAGFGGVDVFIVLSAMGLVLSLSRREQSYGEFLARRGHRILPAYFAVMLPYTLLLILYHGAPWSALVWNSTLLYYWVHCTGAFNWYVAGILLFYALTPPLYRLLRESRRRVALTATLAVIGVGVCQLLMQEGYWQYMDVFYRVPVFLLGALLGFFVRDDRRIGKTDALFWAACALLGVGYAWMIHRGGALHGGIYTPLCHLFLLTTVPMCLVGCALFERLPLGAVRRALRFVGERSLEIYLLNVSFFSEITLLRSFVSFGPTNRLFYLLLFAVNLALGALLHTLVQRAVAWWGNKA